MTKTPTIAVTRHRKIDEGHSRYCICEWLKTVILDETEEDAARTNAYAALIEVVRNESGSDSYIGKKNLNHVDWEWVSKLN